MAVDSPNSPDTRAATRSLSFGRHYTHRVLWVLVPGLVALTQGAALAQLPKPTHPNLVRFGYYYVNEKWGDDTAEAWPDANLCTAVPYNAADSTDPNWQSPFAARA